MLHTDIVNDSARQHRKIYIALLLSLILHAFILLSVSFKLPEPTSTKVAKSIDVILVNSQSGSKPVDTHVLAQANLDGGGNIDEDRRAKTPLPVLPGVKPVVELAEAEQKTQQLEKEVRKLLTAAENATTVVQTPPQAKSAQAQPASPDKNTDLLQRSREIARLEAQIAKEHEAYQKRPKRKFIGARTREYRFARYLEDWRLKVERIGNLNYPEAARKEKLYGSLQLTVGIRSDGSLESIGIDRSSGIQILDDAAIRIVRLAARNGFAPFPPDIKRDTDILHITRTWVFSRADKLLSK
ncbi:TonB family protein [Nitrosomonas sp. ANs5]|uniref:TonB family protein n=1 Tax=Nitrosomonas sp. ANs5 TaxID=3423941 RepID=UPI003D34864D